MSLKKNEEITILQSDKGNATVILNTNNYETKARNILEKAAFRKLKGDPTAKNEQRVNDKLKQLHKSKAIDDRMHNRLRVSVNGT